MSSVSWIEEDAALAEAAREWRGVVGVDTEFQRTNTYYPIPGLYQVVCEGAVWLIDPLGIEDFSPLADVLADPNVTKVMHACSEDLELISHHLGTHVASLFDTQLAYAYLSESYSLSYAGLVEALLGPRLDKHQTRSDWLRRPLSDAQLAYAREDVDYLVPLYDALTDRLRSADRLEWFQEDMARRADYRPNDPEVHYRQVKKAGRLSPNELAVLQSLCAWRERTAMAVDRPRARVVWDEHLVAFAKLPSLDRQALEAVLPRSVRDRYGDGILEAHAAGLIADPLPPLDPPLSRRAGAVTRTLRTHARERAEALGLAAELLARKREIEFCYRHFAQAGELPERYRGWRSDVLGQRFVEILAGDGS